MWSKHMSIQEAERAEHDGNWDDAVYFWSECARRNNDFDCYIRLGRALQRLQRWTEAEDAFLFVWKADPQSYIAAECLGSLNLNREDIEGDAFRDAEDWLRRALKIDQNARAMNLLGVAVESQARSEEAKKCFEAAILLDDSYEEAYVNLAQLVQETSPERALELLERAIEVDPNYALAHQRAGILSEELQDTLAAQYHFERAVELDDLDIWSHLYLASIYAKQMEQSKALAQYVRAVQLDPANNAARGFFISFLEVSGDLDGAKRLRSGSSQP
jgi:tetratricopeptide (TPR) repeat protein